MNSWFGSILASGCLCFGQFTAKGITLAPATAVALSPKGRNTSFAYNRKEAR